MKEVNGSIWHTMSTQRVTPTDFVCVIEISKGSKNKYELDKETGLLILDRILHTSIILRTTVLFPEPTVMTVTLWMYCYCVPSRYSL